MRFGIEIVWAKRFCDFKRSHNSVYILISDRNRRKVFCNQTRIWRRSVRIRLHSKGVYLHSICKFTAITLFTRLFFFFIINYNAQWARNERTRYCRLHFYYAIHFLSLCWDSLNFNLKLQCWQWCGFFSICTFWMKKMRRQSYGMRYICFHRAREKWSVPNDPYRKWNITEFIQNTLKNVEIALFMNSIVAHFLRKQSIIVFQRNNCCCFLASKSASSLSQTIFLSLSLCLSTCLWEERQIWQRTLLVVKRKSQQLNRMVRLMA